MKSKWFLMSVISVLVFGFFLGLFIDYLTPPVGAGSQLKLGDRVVVSTNIVNIKVSPNTRSQNLGIAHKSDIGLIVDGPVQANRRVWWKINYNSGITGWSEEKYLLLVNVTGTSGTCTSTPPVATTTPPVATTTPPVATTTPPVVSSLLWGGYVGDGTNDLSNFETLVGKPVNYYADFEGWDNPFPTALSSKVGQKGKTLVIFWEPSFGFDSIINNSQDTYIKKFAADAKSYGYPVILVPFDEMNLNEEAWGYSMNNNSAAKFQTAWKHIHDLFLAATNVKFGLAYNNVSLPAVSGNSFNDYYPGAAYVDYVGVDGFNFTDPGQTFSQVFDSAMAQLASYNKPIIIFSTGTIAGAHKAAWITDGLGVRAKAYKNLVGWIWFNQGGSPNWLVNSDSNSLQAFKSILP